MPTPQELLQDPFVQELIQLRSTIESLVGVYLQQGVQTTMPFTNQVLSPALNTSTSGVSQLNQALQAGVAQIQSQVAAIVPPVIVVKGGGGPIGGGGTP